MLLFKKYDENLKTEESWFDSTMIVYTSMKESDTENVGDLSVTFKNGATYIYKNVKLEDYVVFIGGGTDGSQGKTLNKLIKPFYETVKSDPKNVELLTERMNKLKSEELEKEAIRERTFFISGHRDMTPYEFEINYKDSIMNALDMFDDSRFVVGDFQGCDIMTQDFLMNVLQLSPDRVTVYHMGDKPNVFNEKITNFKGGFKTHEERDASMTNASEYDIAFVRDNTKISGTASNILRRKMLISVGSYFRN